MPREVERVVEAYISAWCERDPARRQELLEASFAADGRFVTRRRVIQGRAALAAEMARFHADSRWLAVRKLSVIDVGDRTFRFRGAVDFADGSCAEASEAGELNEQGKIALILTFDGPLLEAPQPGGKSTSAFSQYVLHTTDTNAAGAFYDAVLGRRGDGILALPAPALERGARPHWRGTLRARPGGGSDTVRRFIERGAVRLGPPGDGNAPATLKDPGGAVIAIGHASNTSRAGVLWHQLNTRDAATAASNYSELFGWSLGKRVDLGEHGEHQHFAFGPGERNAGVLSGIEDRPGVHAHWLFFFAVPSLDLAVAQVRKHGGTAIGPIDLPGGARVAVCDDPQGAAFGLIAPGDAEALGRE